MLKQGILQVCVRRQCCVGKPTWVLRVFLPEEGRLSPGCSAGSNAGALPPGSAFPCWKEAPLRAEKVKLCCHPRRMGRCVAEEELLGSPAAARQQRGYGRGIAAGCEPRERCAGAGMPLPLPRPVALFGGLRGVQASLPGVSKVCQSPMGLLKSFLSPTGAPAEISHRVIFLMP